MSGGFAVDHDALATHIRQVDELAARMRTAADAGAPLDLLAYGIVGQVFAQAADGATRLGSLTVGGLADLTRELGDGVRATRADYLSMERRNVTALGGAR